MALTDKPQVDPSACNSARSERKLNDWLNEDYGFILKREFPDKGCDYMCELMDGSSATNLKFPVQLKSVQSVTLIKDKEFISYPILTSRLGYMLNGLPTTGIIVLYDVATEKIYGDFTFKIFERIKQAHGSEQWTRQEYVNTHIPLENEFTEESVNNLHQSLTTLFQNAAKMQAAYGEKYTLPVAGIGGSSAFDFNNKEHLKKALKQFGLGLITHFDLAPVFNSLSELTQTEIEQDKELLILACLAYGETGHFCHSDLFINKLKRTFQLDDQEEAMIEYAACKNLMHLGRLTAPEFMLRMDRVSQQVKGPLNTIILRINRQRLELMSMAAFSPASSAVITEMLNIFEAIGRSGLDEGTKDILTLWNAEQQSHLLTHQLQLDAASLDLSRVIRKEISAEEQGASAMNFIRKEALFFQVVDTVYKRAFDKGNKYTMATALSLLARHFIYKQLTYINQGMPFPVEEELYKKYFSFAFQAYQLFAEISQLKDAHYSLSCALEILYAARHFNYEGMTEDIEGISKEKHRMETHLLLEPYPLQVPKLIETVTKNNNAVQDKTFSQLSDDQLTQLVKNLFTSLKLPEEKFMHLLNEFRAVRLFQQRCDNPDIRIFRTNIRGTKEDYSQPVSFVLQNEKTGELSDTSSNIEQLLSSWGY